MMTNDNVSSLSIHLDYMKSCCLFINESFTEDYYTSAIYLYKQLKRKIRIATHSALSKNSFTAINPFFLTTITKKRDAKKS